MSLEPGQVIDGKYRIVRQLGVGGMGAVYEGENVRIHRKVAIKVLHAQVATKADIVQRFEREAQAAGRIGSKHIVEVLDLGNLPSGDRFMVMEYLDGESLGERLKKLKAIAAADLVPIVVQVLDGLGAAHEAGIVHRDLKPDNVYLLKARSSAKPEEFVKLLDFGVSKFSSLDGDMNMTSAGAVMGTPYYLSPEQARGAQIDARSDLYALGVVLYQCLAGHVPFNAESFNELIFKIALDSPRPLGEAVPGIDPALVAIVEKAMHREASSRYQSAGEMRAALSSWLLSGAPGGALRSPAATAATAALAASSAALAPGGMAPGGMAPGGMAPGGMAPAHGASIAGGPLGRPAGAFDMSAAGPLGASFGGSAAPLAASSPLAHSLGQSQAASPGGGQLGPSALGQSGGPLGQSGGPLGQSGGPMGLSSVALAVTAPPRKAPMVAAMVAVTLLVGGALGGGMWYAMGAKTARSDPALAATGQAPETTATPPAEPSVAPSTDAPPPEVASAAPEDAATAPSAEPSAAPVASAAPSSKPVSSPRPAGDKPAGTRPAGGRPGGGGTKPPPGGGRVITPTL